MKKLTCLIGLILFTFGLNAQFIVNNTGNNINEYINTVNIELNLNRNIRINFNISETNTSLYLISDEENHVYDVYIRQTNDKLFYCELLAVAIIRIKEIDSNQGYTNWATTTYTSQRLAYEYQYLYE